jgi:hypothetical protein
MENPLVGEWPSVMEILWNLRGVVVFGGFTSSFLLARTLATSPSIWTITLRTWLLRSAERFLGLTEPGKGASVGGGGLIFFPERGLATHPGQAVPCKATDDWEVQPMG